MRTGRPLSNDLTGQRYGRLVVLERAANQGSKIRWLCACDCGRFTVVQSCNLISGCTRSCGCYQKERASESLSILRQNRLITP